jgi:hypothetical protein
MTGFTQYPRSTRYESDLFVAGADIGAGTLGYVYRPKAAKGMSSAKQTSKRRVIFYTVTPEIGVRVSSKKTTIATKYKNENTFRDQCRWLAPNGVRRT